MILNWKTEDKTIYCYYCHVLEPYVDKEETQKTEYLLKGSVNMMLYVCLRVLVI